MRRLSEHSFFVAELKASRIVERRILRVENYKKKNFYYQEVMNASMNFVYEKIVFQLEANSCTIKANTFMKPVTSWKMLLSLLEF